MKKTIKLILSMLCLAGFVGSASAQYKTSEWAERDKWQNVPAIIKALKLAPGSKVADIGSHEGYLSMHLAKAVGHQGKVYSVDLQQYKLNTLQAQAKKRGYHHVKTILGAYDNPKLPAGSLDAIVVMRVYHEISSYNTYLKHLYKALKPGGRLVILESIRKNRVNWSRSRQTSYHEMSIPVVKAEVEKAGFTNISSIAAIAYWKKNKKRPLWLMTGIKKISE